MNKITDKNYLEIIKEEEISNIHFYGIDFSLSDFSIKNFNDCIFEKCNLSNVKIKNTTFNNVVFLNTKIMGLQFGEINTFLSNFIFKDCNISLTSFRGIILRDISFEDSNLNEADFTNTSLINANFSYCDLSKSIFSNTNLKNANFVGSYNFSINPEINNLEKTKFSRENAIGLINYLDIIIE